MDSKIILNYIMLICISTGSTERDVLRNFEDIVQRSLPLDKVTHYYLECAGAAREVVLNYVTFFEDRIKVGLVTDDKLR